MNGRYRFAILPLALLGWLALEPATAAGPAPAAVQVAVATASEQKVTETKAAMRDLWIGHIFWVRNVVIETFAKNPAAAKAAEAEVVADAKQIAAAIEPFYGQPAADKLFSLLAGHYGAIKDYLTATVKKDQKAQAAATDALMANAEQIADFLSSANPNLPKDALMQLLSAHGGHHIQEIQDVAAKHYEAEATTWSEMRGHIYVIADALVDALAKQFPDKF